MFKDQIIQGDASDILPRISDSSVDLVIADPPYSIRKDFGPHHPQRTFDSWLVWCRAWLKECARILKPYGNLMVYSIPASSAHLQLEMLKLGLVYRRQIIWHYENGFSRFTKAPACEYEVILWFAHSKDSTFQPIREPYKSPERLRHKIVKNGKIWTPHPDGRLAGDVWKIPTLAGKRFSAEKVDHPTQKPLALSSRLVSNFSNSGDFVVVPFAGSGSELVAAKSHGRRFLGIELNPIYIDICQERLLSIPANCPRQEVAREGTSIEKVPVPPQSSYLMGFEPTNMVVSGLDVE